MHHDQLLEHGGLPALHDENALEAALARPRHRLAYDPGADLPALAAAYGHGLAAGHAFNDGNKRVALLAMYTFLGLNGRELEAPEPEVVRVMLDLASGRLTEDALAGWLREHLAPLPREAREDPKRQIGRSYALPGWGGPGRREGRAGSERDLPDPFLAGPPCCKRHRRRGKVESARRRG